MPPKIRKRIAFPANTHGQYFSYPAKVERIGRALDGQLSEIFGLLLRVAIRDPDGLGTEAHNALLALGRARCELKLLRLAPARQPKPFYDRYFPDLDTVVTESVGGTFARPIQTEPEDDD